MSEYTMLKQRFENSVFKKESDKTTTKAIEKAYADMSRRASGHNPSIKEACTNWLETRVFTQSLSISDFDSWHKEVCLDLVNKFNDAKKGFGTIGRAQKVINMAFKYFSCITKNYDEYLEFAHMTLDGYTLAWYKSFVMPWAKKNGYKDVSKVVEWSKITDYDHYYMLIQNNIRNYLKEKPRYSAQIKEIKTPSLYLPQIPFEAEFIVWEGEIVKAKYDNLIKELGIYKTRSSKKESSRKKDSWMIGKSFDDFLKDYCKDL
jgi:hypothetical protein